MSKPFDGPARIAEAKAKLAAAKAALSDADRAEIVERAERARRAEREPDVSQLETGPKLTIVGSKSDLPLGEISGDGLHYGNRSGSLTSGGRALIELLGNGFGNVRFHIIAGDVMLVNCQIGQMRGGGGFDVHCSFSYEKEQPAR